MLGLLWLIQGENLIFSFVIPYNVISHLDLRIFHNLGWEIARIRDELSANVTPWVDF